MQISSFAYKCVLAVCGHYHPTMIQMHSLFESPKTKTSYFWFWSECTALSSTCSTTTEVRPLSKAPNTQLLLGCRSNMAAHCSGCVCVLTTVCVHLDGLNAEHKFRVWVTISGHTSLHVTFTKLIYAWLRKSFYSRLFSERGTSQGRFCYLKCEKNLTPFVILNIFISDCNLITHFFSVTDYNYFYL